MVATGRFSGFVWAKRSTCVMAFLWRPNRRLGAIFWQFLFECHTWSTRTRGCSPSRSENKETWDQIHKEKGSYLATVPSVLGHCRISKSWVWTFLILAPESGKNWWLKKVQYLQQKYHCKWTVLRGTQPKFMFHNFGDQHANAAFSLTVWVPSSGRVNSGNQRTWTNLLSSVKIQCRRIVTP